MRLYQFKEYFKKYATFYRRMSVKIVIPFIIKISIHLFQETLKMKGKIFKIFFTRDLLIRLVLKTLQN